MATENLKFKIELYSTHWDKPPQVEIFINDKCVFEKTSVSTTKDRPLAISFEEELENDKSYDLIIKRTGKDTSQTILNDKGDITHDQLLHIKNIEIDEIDLGNLVFEGIYKPEYPEKWAKQQKAMGEVLPETLKSSPHLGHNGTWTFGFGSPFYMWLLDNLY